MLKRLLTRLLASPTSGSKNSSPNNPEQQPLSSNLDENLKALHEVFDLCSDVIFREFKFGMDNSIRAVIIYVNGLSDTDIITNNILSILMQSGGENSLKTEHLQGTKLSQYLLERVTTLSQIETANNLEHLVEYIENTNVALLIEGSALALVGSVAGGEKRTVAEPDSEPIVRGPKDGFIESLETNITLLRRRLKTSQFKVENLQVGKLTKTKVAVCYIKGIANEKIVEEVKTRIQRVKIDGILASGYLEEFISDERFTVFPLIQTTERPDKTAASLLEGRIAIIVDNTPMVMIAPCTYVSLLQAAEDYYLTSVFASLLRLLRFVGLNIALLLPAITIATFSFHQEIIPTALLYTVAGARQELPLPIFVELIIMEMIFELLREAGIRLPKAIGQTVSTVGGLVIGQAAVEAGIISGTSVIVISLTAIASFTIPNYPAETSIRILRFFLMLCAAFLGGVGIMFGLMVILIHLASLRSFGVPYLSPIAPLSLKDLKDTVIRAPWWAMDIRPRFPASKDPQRQDPNQGPQKPKNTEE